LNSLFSNQDLKLICFLPLSANYSTHLFRQRLCSRLTVLWRYINFVLLLLLLLSTVKSPKHMQRHSSDGSYTDFEFKCMSQKAYVDSQN